MSKTNVKNPAVPASQSSASATGGADGAVLVQPQTAAAPVQEATPEPDQNHGRGGLYTVVQGARQRVAGTQATHETKEG